MHVWVEHELFRIYCGNHRELDNVDYFFLFVSDALHLPLMNLKEHTAISGSHLQQSNISDTSLIFATVWLERGTWFLTPKYHTQTLPQPCFEAACRRRMACGCKSTEVHWPWGDPAVSPPLCLKRWFCFTLGSKGCYWFLAGIAASANLSHVGAPLVLMCRWVRCRWLMSRLSLT